MKHAFISQTASGFIACLVAIGASAQTFPCFDEFHQIYEYDDGGRGWELARRACGGNASSTRQKSGGRLEVRNSGENVYFYEHVFHWAPVANPETGLCTGLRKVNRHTKKALIEGAYYELVENDDKPPRRKEKRGGRIHIPNTSTLPGDLSHSPFVDLGEASIAGHRCQRFRTAFGNNQSSVNCIMRLAPKCPAARYMLPLEQIAPEGDNRIEGRTTFLRTGTRGSVLGRTAISPP